MARLESTGVFMIHEKNDSMETILSTVSQEQIEHQKFLDEMEQKAKVIRWRWKMLGIAVGAVALWFVVTGWMFQSGDKEHANGKRIKNPYVNKTRVRD